MVSSKSLSLALLSFMVPALALDPATIWSKEPCTGESAEIPSDNKCTPVPEPLAGKVTAVTVPENVVCNFFRDENCQEPILYSVEDPGICTFSEWDVNDNKVSNESASVQCYDSTD
ncbi:hypothetical protein BDV38DRAFT_278577 [Aspergillus pseudotamarii]|uniref:Uncharacterized protein n=1 Tax=Aspergillus pseudotamarii TaxID=132259 RepID=A0A5N6T646_ASPPS|nr:uncharacterized protein BDV38DRAFT_278577 [Aspergillus pseudotamarii]KAE8141794.1 hypothetical protein BDV38DRAFT_278577 [Aspergillus pseudotamarii]